MRPFGAASRGFTLSLPRPPKWDGLTGVFPKTKWNGDVISIFKERTFLLNTQLIPFHNVYETDSLLITEKVMMSLNFKNND